MNMNGINRIEIICSKVPYFKELYSARVRHYIIKDHILNVFNQFEKYFEKNFEKSDIEKFKLFLLIHDIGKSLAYNKGDKNNQHNETINLIHKYKSDLDLSDESLVLYEALLKADFIGKYIENKASLDDTYDNVINQGKSSKLPISKFFYLLSVYYQCDVASYTKDAGGIPYLEYLFEYQNSYKIYCQENNLLKFKDIQSQRYNLLFNKINKSSEFKTIESDIISSTISTKDFQLKVIDKVDLSKFERPKKEIHEDKENLYIIDTNVFVDYPDIISKISKEYPVILSAKVIDELDNLKSTLNNDGKTKVQQALKSINRDYEKRDLRLEMADLSLLPIDFDKRAPDNMILSVALKYSSENPILLTSDNGLQAKAKCLKITTIKLNEFLEQLKTR